MAGTQRNQKAIIIALDGNEKARRFADGVLFLGVLILSAIAVLALTIATPFVLLISVIIGLFQTEPHSGNWRRAGA